MSGGQPRASRTPAALEKRWQPVGTLPDPTARDLLYWLQQAGYGTRCTWRGEQATIEIKEPRLDFERVLAARALLESCSSMDTTLRMAVDSLNTWMATSGAMR